MDLNGISSTVNQPSLSSLPTKPLSSVYGQTTFPGNGYQTASGNSAATVSISEQAKTLQAASIAPFADLNLTVRANDASKQSGEMNPSFSASITGFQGADGAGTGTLSGAVVFMTAATTSSPPGQYAITPAGLSSAKYLIAFQNGTLTITEKSETPKAEPE